MSGVAIVADSWSYAETARKQLQVNGKTGSRRRQQRGVLPAPLPNSPWKAHTAPRAGRRYPIGFASAARWSKPLRYSFLATRRIEPPNATAIVKDAKLEISTARRQQPGGVIATMADALSDLRQPTSPATCLGWAAASGRRLYDDYVVEIAVIAKTVGARCELRIVSRRRDAPGGVSACGYHFLKGGLDGKGSLVAWRNHFVSFARRRRRRRRRVRSRGRIRGRRRVHGRLDRRRSARPSSRPGSSRTSPR